MRGPENRKGREILRPEIPRTLHFGTKGTSNNQFGSFLSAIALHSEPPVVDWTRFDADSMRHRTYETQYMQAVSNRTNLCGSGRSRQTSATSKASSCLAAYCGWRLVAGPCCYSSEIELDIREPETERPKTRGRVRRFLTYSVLTYSGFAHASNLSSADSALCRYCVSYNVRDPSNFDLDHGGNW